MEKISKATKWEIWEHPYIRKKKNVLLKVCGVRFYKQINVTARAYNTSK